jgi:hypothetical protein
MSAIPPRPYFNKITYKEYCRCERYLIALSDRSLTVMRVLLIFLLIALEIHGRKGEKVSFLVPILKTT